MKKLILLALVCTGFAVTTPFTAHALDSEKIAQYVGVASPLENRDQNRDNQNRDNQNRDNRDRDSQDSRYRNRNRPFTVSYRSSDDSPGERLRQRRWIFDSVHYSLRDARRAANRLERRGYRTLVLG